MGVKKCTIVVVFIIFIDILYTSFTNKLSINNSSLFVNPKLITPISLIYPIQITREYFQSKFIFGDEDQCNWLLTLAQKRISESMTLKQHHLNDLAQKQLNIAQKYLDESKLLLIKLKDKTDINYLSQKMAIAQDSINSLKSN